MIKNKIIIIVLTITLLNGCYTKFDRINNDQPISKQLVGEWTRENNRYPDVKPPVYAPYTQILDFKKDKTYSSSISGVNGFYKILNDTLVVFDNKKLNPNYFMIIIDKRIELELKKILDENVRNEFASPIEGKWKWAI